MFLHRLHVYRTPARITAAVELCITSNISGVSVFQIILADIVVSLNEIFLSRSVVFWCPLFFSAISLWDVQHVVL